MPGASELSSVPSKDIRDEEKSFGLELLFANQEEKDQVEAQIYIEAMTKYKLYEIFY